MREDHMRAEWRLLKTEQPTDGECDILEQVIDGERTGRAIIAPADADKVVYARCSFDEYDSMDKDLVRFLICRAERAGEIDTARRLYSILKHMNHSTPTRIW